MSDRGVRRFTRARFALVAGTAIATLLAIVELGSAASAAPRQVSAAVAATAPAGIAFRSASSASAPVRSGLMIPVPAGIQAGDVMLASIGVRGWSDVFTAPAGWTLLQDDLKNTAMRQATYVHLVGSAGEPASYNWTFNKGYEAVGVMLAYSGVDNANPVDAVGGLATNPSASITAPSVTTTSANDMVVGFFGTSIAATITPPTGTTDRGGASWTAGSQTQTIGSADIPQQAVAPTGALVATASQPAANVGHTVALRPSGNPPPPPAGPLANDDKYSGTVGQTLTIPAATGVLANDTSPSGGTLTAALATGVSHGTLTLSANGGFTYTPAAGYAGNDAFTYTATDQVGTSAPATVTITLSSAPPTAVADNYSTTAGTTLTVDAAHGVLANDTAAVGGALSAAVATGPAHGTLSLAADGSFSYTPATGYSGTDSFSYRASNSAGTSSPATVSITISAPPAGPVATADSYSTPAGTALIVPAASGVLANDTTPSGTLTAALASTTTNGSLSLASDGSFSYTPATGFVGTDSFTYTASNGSATSAPATVTITVTSVNHPPTVTSPGSQTNSEGDSVSLQITASDPDPGDAISYAASGLPSGLSISSSGRISGVIAVGAAANSPYSVTITVTDTSNATATANFSWTVTPAMSGTGTAALWHMDETSGTTMFDSSGNGNDGAMTAVTFGVPGWLNTGYRFNGVNSIGIVSDSPSLNPGSLDFSITAHVKFASTPPIDFDVVRKGLGSSPGGDFKFELFATSSGVQGSCVARGSASRAGVTAGPDLADGAWHTVGCVKTAHTFSLVVDGVSFSQQRSIGSLSNTVDMTVGAQIGADFFNGVMDEVTYSIG